MSPHRPLDPASPPPSPLLSRAVYILGAGAVAVAALGVVTFQRGVARAAAEEHGARAVAAGKGPRVLTAVVQAAPPSKTLQLTGEVKPFREATLYAKVSGYVREVRVDKGDTVTQGQVLGAVESPESDGALKAREAVLVEKTENQRRYAALLPAGVVSRQDVDRANADLDVAKAELSRAAAQKSYETIRAPFDGVVTARFADPGALLPAATGSTQSAQPFAIVADVKRVRVFVYASQRDAVQIHPGDAATVTPLDGAAAVGAKVTRMARALDPRTRTMPVEIVLDNPDGALLPGAFVGVRLEVAARPSVSVPGDAVFLRGGKPTVALVREGRAKFVNVDVGDLDGKSVRVLAGVAAGDVVALHVGDEVSDGGPVTATPSDGARSASR